MQMKNPVHPGALIKSELEAMEIPVATAAKALGITRQQLYNVINCRSAITPEMAVRLAKGIGSTAETWLAMQQAFDLSRVKAKAIRVSSLSRMSARPRPARAA
ncbi:MAG TPA: HigA family addiction module antitoxin [Micropepsaceae bacterium]|nr:HigA family addiction module antitoxin [Micropepsaceae bacterium]